MDKIKAFVRDNWDGILKPTVVLFAICLVIALALASANLVTAPKIAQLEAENLNQTMEKVITADKYTENTVKYSGESVKYYTAEKDGKAAGYIFTFSEKGYGGDVNVMTAIDTDGKIIAVEILDASNETPGLGQNVTKEDFYSQYKDKNGTVTVVKNGADAANGEIDAATGATISSKAVTRAVNRAVDVYSHISDKGGAEK